MTLTDSDEERLDIAASYYAGERVESLADRYGTPAHTIYYVLQRQAVPRHHDDGRERPPRPDLQAALPAIAAAYRAGAGSALLGRRYRVDARTIIHFLRRNGVAIRPAGAHALPMSESREESR